MLEDTLTIPRLMAYYRRWDLYLPPMISLHLIATAHGYKPKSKPKPQINTSTQRQHTRADELGSILKMFPGGRIS